MPPIGELRGLTDFGRDAAWRTSTVRPVANALESHKAFLAEVCERVNNERAVFASYSACCEEILGQVRAAAAASADVSTDQQEKGAAAADMVEMAAATVGHPQHPSRLLIVTATMMLFKLSFLTEAQGPLMRTLLNEVLHGVFEKYECPPECDVGSAFVLREEHPVAQDVDCNFLLQLPVYFDEIVAARERADAALRSSAKVRLALLAASEVAGKLIDRGVRERLRQTFVAWHKTAVRLRRAREAIGNVGWHTQRRKRLRLAFNSWRLGIALTREQRMLELSARNSERLTARARELSQRIDLRESELERQRNLKESYVMKADRVEDMLNTLREEVVRVRAKLMDSEARSRGSFEVASGLVRRLENSHLNRAATGPLASLELDGEITARRLNAPTGPSAARRALGAAASPASAALVVPVAKDPFTHVSSVSESRPWKVGNPQAFLVAWINDVLDRMSLGPMAAIVPAMAGRIKSLVPDLCSGKIYVALFNYLSVAPHSMYVTFDSEGERRAAIISAAQEEGIDCLLRPEDLAKEDELPHMALCCTLFSRYCEMQAAGLCAATKPAGNELVPLGSGGLQAPGDEITTLSDLMERAEALLRNIAANKRWSDVHQILASTIAGVSVQRCFGVVKGTSMTGLAGFSAVTITAVRTLRPPALKFSDDPGEDEARCERLAVSMQSCLGALRGIVLDAFFFYASHVSTDSLDPYTLDRTAWRKLLTELKLLYHKKSGQHQELLLDMFDHPSFPVLSALIPPPSPVILNIEDWLIAIVRLFFAKIEVSKTPAATTEVLSNLFRTFVVENICKNVGMLKHADFVAEFGTPELQSTFRQYRDPLRKIYNELTSAPPHRFRLDMFVHLATRLKVPLDPEVELPHCFASVRIALTDRTTIATTRLDVGNQRGVDFSGFCALVYVLSQAKMGGNPFALKGTVLEMFLTTCFFVHFQGRVPLLRW